VGCLFFKKFKVPKTTQKKINQRTFEVKFNTNFRGVIENCSKIPRNHETGTWILPEMVEAYTELFNSEKAISVEAWREGQLVGGLYGVLFHGVFSGESMFFKETEASKVCLVALIEDLKSRGHQWLDIQMVTPLLEQFGGEYVSRQSFLDMLKKRQQEVREYHGG
jgi:leucyl/phenylalanyl-tRNA--protein transferase